MVARHIPRCIPWFVALVAVMATRHVRAADSDVAPSTPPSPSGSTPPAAPEAASPPEQQPGAPTTDAQAAPVEILVTATRSPRRSRDVSASATVLSRAEINRSPAKTSDELLRVLPSFGLFRRSSSVVADPSSQGVNLRGIGPSGVSRSLVLRDGLPMNDAFGGWVYWRALPMLGIGRIEVVPAAGRRSTATMLSVV